MELREPSAKYLVRPGYKQTEVGVIPEDWEVTSLGAICNIAAGGDLIRSEFSDCWSEKHRYPIYANGLKERGLYGYSSTAHCSTEAVTVTARGDIGHATYRGSGFCAIGRLLVLTVQKPCDLRFLAECINERIAFALESTGVPQLTAPQISKYLVGLPSLVGEQQAIADALGDADALIESLEHLLAKQRLLRQATMQALLTGERRLPGFEGAWREKLLGDFTDCVAGGTPSTAVPEYWGGSIRWMSSGELNLKQVTEVEGRITEEGLQSSSAKMLPVGCVLIGLAGQGRTRGTVAMNHVPLCTNQSVAAIFPSESFDSRYLFYNLERRYEELRELSAGDGGRGGLNLTIIRGLSVPFPSIEEQTAIATVLSDLDAEIAALEARIAKARLLKQGMMQELLTGRIRLV